MTMEETKSGFVWTCDRCGLVAQFFPPTGFWSAVDELRARGWQFDRDYDGGWSALVRQVRAEGDGELDGSAGSGGNEKGEGLEVQPEERN